MYFDDAAVATPLRENTTSSVTFDNDQSSLIRSNRVRRPQLTLSKTAEIASIPTSRERCHSLSGSYASHVLVRRFHALRLIGHTYFYGLASTLTSFFDRFVDELSGVARTERYLTVFTLYEVVDPAQRSSDALDVVAGCRFDILWRYLTTVGHQRIECIPLDW